MYRTSELKIPKKLRQVTLWVHPEGRLVGSLFLNLQSKKYTGGEEPLEVLNQADPFLVCKRADPDELRFYNKASIVHVEYHEETLPPSEGVEPLQCRLYMMDGAIIEGSIRRLLPPGRSRLYDYLNMDDEQFIKLYVENGNVCLVNKSYIVCATPLSTSKSDVTKLLPDEWEPDDTAVFVLAKK
jgi:hypothetical protein